MEKNKITLFEAIANNYIDSYNYRYNSYWSLMINYGINDTAELEKYCKNNGIDIIYKDDHNLADVPEFKINKQFHFDKAKRKTYHTTATLKSSSNHIAFYSNFGIRPKSCVLYGHEESDILGVSMKFHEDQTINKDVQEYWGFYDYTKKELTSIYPSYSQLYVCFAEGVENAEKSGKGFAVKLDVRGNNKSIEKFLKS